jgi:hypothetical protein
VTSEQVATGGIELGFTLSADDLLDGVIAQSRRGTRRWTLPALLVFAPLAGVAIGFVRAHAWEVSPDAVPKLVIVSLGLLVGGMGFGLLLYWLVVRLLPTAVYRWQVRLIMRGNPWMLRPIRGTVTDTGVQLVNSAAESTSTWAQFPLYAETELSFVLQASKRRGAATLVVPKRGLINADAAVLRTLLDSHCRRR